MGWGFPLLTLLIVLMAISALYFAVDARRKEHAPASISFGLLMLAITAWLLAEIGQILTYPYLDPLAWFKVASLSSAWISTLWLTFCLDFTKRRDSSFSRYGWLLVIAPVVFTALVFTNELHSWIWTNVEINVEGSILASPAAGYWGFAIYNYLLLLAGMVILLHSLERFPLYKRRQVGVLLAGMVLPPLVGLGQQTGFAPQFPVNIVPYVYAFSGWICSLLLYRLGLFNPIPLAREMIFEQMSEGYISLDPSNRVLDINLSARLMLKLSKTSYEGQPAAVVLRKWPLLVDIIGRLPEGRVEMNLSQEPFQCIEVSLSTWYLKGNRAAGKILSLHDITARKLAEEERQRSDQIYRLLVNSSPVGIVMTDTQGKITFSSPEVNQLLGLSEEKSILGTHFSVWLHPEDRDMTALHFQHVLNGNNNIPTTSYRIIRADEQVIWADILSARLSDAPGASNGLLSIIRDVTTRNEMNRQLERNLDQLTLTSDLLQMMVKPDDIMHALNQALYLVGEHIRCDRVYLCQDRKDETETSILFEWCRSGIIGRAKEGPFLRYGSLPSWKRHLEQNGMFRFSKNNPSNQENSYATEIDRLPDDIAEFMDTWDIHTLVVYPIYGAENRPSGFLGFDFCQPNLDWSIENDPLISNVSKIISGAVSRMEDRLNEQRQRLMTEALQDTAQALKSTLNTEEVLDRILANVEAVVPSDAASIALVDPDGSVQFVRWRGYDFAGGDGLKNLDLSLSGRETYQWMTTTGDVVIVQDTWLDPRWSDDHSFSWVRSYAGAPIQAKGKPVGFLNLDNAEPDYFLPDAAERLRVFADQAGVAIENARLYHLAHRRADEMSTLYRIGLALTANINMEQVLTALCEQCQAVLPIDIFYVLLYDAQSKQLNPGIYFQDGEYEALEPNLFSGNTKLADVVFGGRRTIVYQDSTVAEDEGKIRIFRIGGKRSRSYVAVPLIILDQVVGVISIQNYYANAYSEEQVQLLETIATQASIAVYNARLYDRMHQMAITDSVTKLYTRHHFTSIGNNEVERARRYNRSLSVLMADIDHFKSVNDTHGHNAGDHVLFGVAQTCSQVLRTTDRLGRWGGEEFVILLPEAEEDGAAMIAERIRRVVSETEILLSDGKKVKVTISLGVATLRAGQETLEALVDCADKAMYQAKQAGRNRVCIWRPETNL